VGHAFQQPIGNGSQHRDQEGQTGGLLLHPALHTLGTTNNQIRPKAESYAHTYHRLLDADAYLPLGSTAHKQGTVAGENAAGGDRLFAGSLGTQVVKVFDVVAARTGLRDHEAVAHGLHPVSTLTVADDHKRYYPGARPIHIKVTGDQTTGRPLGAQLVGHRDTAVAKRSSTPPPKPATADNTASTNAAAEAAATVGNWCTIISRTSSGHLYRP